MREGWGKPNEAFMKAFTYIYLPTASDEQAAWYSKLQQENASADVAVAIRDACDHIDVMHLLRTIKAPTLLTHCRGDLVVPLEHGRSIATNLPNAQFIQLDSDNHIILDTEPEAPTLC